jgi:hypothetical protein
MRVVLPIARAPHALPCRLNKMVDCLQNLVIQ